MTAKAQILQRHRGAFCRRMNVATRSRSGTRPMFVVWLSRNDARVWTRGGSAAHAWRNAWLRHSRRRR